MIGPTRSSDPLSARFLPFCVLLAHFFSLFPSAPRATSVPTFLGSSRWLLSFPRSLARPVPLLAPFSLPIAHCAREPPAAFLRLAQREKKSRIFLLAFPAFLVSPPSSPLPSQNTSSLLSSFFPPQYLSLSFFPFLPLPALLNCNWSCNCFLEFLFLVTSPFLFSHQNGPDHVPERTQTVDARRWRHLCEQSGWGTFSRGERIFLTKHTTRDRRRRRRKMGRRWTSRGSGRTSPRANQNRTVEVPFEDRKVDQTRNHPKPTNTANTNLLQATHLETKGSMESDNPDGQAIRDSSLNCEPTSMVCQRRADSKRRQAAFLSRWRF